MGRVMPDTKGFGSCAAMVQVASKEQAATAIQALNGMPASSVNCVQAEQQPSKVAELLAYANTAVPEAKPMIVRYAGQFETPSDNLYVTNLPSPSVEQSDLHAMFTALGLNVVRSRVLPDIR